jgi:hypothetical protein
VEIARRLGIAEDDGVFKYALKKIAPRPKKGDR